MNKKFIIGIGIVGVIALASLIVSIVGLVGVNQLSQLLNSEQLGAIGTRFPNGLAVGSGASISTTGEFVSTQESTLGDNTVKWNKGTIAAGSWQTCEQPNTSATTTIIDAQMGYQDRGNASSTYKMAMFATSTATIGNNYIQTALPTAFYYQGALKNIISLATYATSTVGTTTPRSLNDHGDIATIPPSWYVCTVLQFAGSSFMATVNGAGGESATSSVRGITPFYRYLYVR